MLGFSRRTAFDGFGRRERPAQARILEGPGSRLPISDPTQRDVAQVFRRALGVRLGPPAVRGAGSSRTTALRLFHPERAYAESLTINAEELIIN